MKKQYRGEEMKGLVVKMLKHVEKRKKEYWGKDEYIYRFYDGGYVVCLDLLLQYEREKKDANG